MAYGEGIRLKETPITKSVWAQDWRCCHGEGFELETEFSLVTARRQGSALKIVADFSEGNERVGDADLRKISREPCRSSVSEKRQQSAYYLTVNVS